MHVTKKAISQKKKETQGFDSLKLNLFTSGINIRFMQSSRNYSVLNLGCKWDPKHFVTHS